LVPTTYKSICFWIDLYLNSMKLILAIFALLFVANCYTFAGHAISGDASKQVAAGIKAELYIFVHLDSLPYPPLLTKPLPRLLKPISPKLMPKRELWIKSTSPQLAKSSPYSDLRIPTVIKTRTERLQEMS